MRAEGREGQHDRGRFLTALAGAAAALAGRSLVSTPDAGAANGQPLVLGASNSSTAKTSLDAATSNFALSVQNTGGGDGVVGGSSGAAQGAVVGENLNDRGIGVWGVGGTGVLGAATSDAGSGVMGTGFRGVEGRGQFAVYGIGDDIGVLGETVDTTDETYGVSGRVQGSKARAVFGWSQNASDGGTGVWGQCNSRNGAAVRGYAWDGDGASGKFGTGVIGTSGSHGFPPPDPLPETGIYGIAAAPSGGASAAGVVGDSTTMPGVAGFSAAPARAAGEFKHTGGGFALDVQGPARFAQSGVVVIPSGSRTATVSGVPLRTDSLVLATVQDGSGVWVESAVPNPSVSKIKISLNRAVPTGKKAHVAWLVVN